MNLTLQSAELTVEINPIGMELSSIKSKSTGLEYIWQGDPAVWNSQAPVLFPIIGALKNGYSLINGNKYEMPKHGLVRNSHKPRLIEQTDTSLTFRLTWDEESLKNYPFKFQLDMIFTLVGKTLTIEHHVSNLSEETMLYSLGGHPAFNCPLRDGEVYEDYLLEFAQKETDSTWIVEDTGLIGLNQRLMLDNTAILPLHTHLFDNDALIFKQLKSREVTFKHKDRGAILSVNFEDFDYLGIWAKPGAPFVCIEPWLGIGDSSDSNHHFEEKDGILKLEAKESEAKKYSITILK
ncbi:aldose 1-epimerase family protein [Algoriphagus antarcticus]|uniref:Galactose mutarotase-like enzyme n=1 Tax=Algoriphagus antarcticus TaxID=238540 RepID=A0A3E0EB98_9BACT|nr:aldose 1-epimerase family protein [Algoriphagus antarcticus]REG94286.1 galactose mutarotase-like enzyme [Algoriphagus antarcticus]